MEAEHFSLLASGLQRNTWKQLLNFAFWKHDNEALQNVSISFV